MLNILLQATAQTGTVEGLHFTTENIGEALLCSGAGMIGIFIVILVIWGLVALLNKVTSPKD